MIDGSLAGRGGGEDTVGADDLDGVGDTGADNGVDGLDMSACLSFAKFKGAPSVAL